MSGLHPFVGVSFGEWLRLLARSGGISRSAIPNVATVTAFSLALTPVRWIERALYDREIRNTTVDAPPVFLLGHWRSGTTFLENLLACDPNRSYLNLIQSILPQAFLTTESVLKHFVKPRKRYMDNVLLGPTSPSEEEVAMAVLAPGSFWHGYYFPKQMDDYFYKYTLFEGIEADELERWKSAYLWLIKKLTYRNEGRQLILKNPPNTGRIGVLLDLFPDAKFIHIYRNPIEVFDSRMAQYASAVCSKALQPISEAEWEERVFRYYTAMLEKHYQERDLIPAGNYLELRFEDLRADPLEQVRGIYRNLNLDGFEATRPALEKHLSDLSGYRQNTYDPNDENVSKVIARWGSFVRRWGYDASL